MNRRDVELTEENLKKLKRSTLKLEESLVELKKDLVEIIKKLEKEEKQFFKLEEIPSSYQYPPDRKIRDIREQLTHLRKYFPDFRFKTSIPLILPEGAEGWLVVPKFSKIAPTYNKGLEKMLEILAKKRPDFLNGREEELGEEYLKLDNRTRMAIEILEETFKGDYIVIPVQMGRRYLGRSSRRAKVLFNSNEFGLGPLEVTVFLLTHPEWLTNEEDLGIDCVGGEYGPYKHARFKNILCFYYLKEKLHLNDRWGGCPDKKFGAATGFLFLPKSFKLT